MTVYIVNPLGAALAHYSSELESVLNKSGVQAEIISDVEPGVSGRSRFHWLVAHFWNVRRAASNCGTGDSVITVWPVLGYFDLAINRVLGKNRTWLIVHDPNPLVRSLGYGRIGRLLLRWSKPGRIICHSRNAVQTVAEQGRRTTQAHLLPHPIANSSQGRFKKAVAGRVLVIGQYKPDRDLELLRHIGTHLHDEANLLIAGRGWPNIKYWNTVDRFLSESEFFDEIASASVVLIPYRRFFQSGVAVRCIEMGIPFIGPKGSSLEELVGSDSLMVQDIENKDAWINAIEKVLKTGAVEMESTRVRCLEMCHTQWSKWLSTMRNEVTASRSDNIVYE
jgi:hypothetical protein